MNQTEAFEKVVKVITPYTKNTAALANVKSETRLLEDLGVNSARLVDIVLAFEDEFSIAIDGFFARIASRIWWNACSARNSLEPPTSITDGVAPLPICSSTDLRGFGIKKNGAP